MVMGHFLFQKSSIGIYFKQNCDLPLFPGPDKTVVLSMNRVCGIMMRRREEDDDNINYEFDEAGAFEGLEIVTNSCQRGREEGCEFGKGEGFYFQGVAPRLIEVIGLPSMDEFCSIFKFRSCSRRKMIVPMELRCHGFLLWRFLWVLYSVADICLF